MNLKDLKNSNILTSIYIDSLDNRETLEETFFSISKQTHLVDLLVIHNLNDEDVKVLEEILNKPKIVITQKVEDKLEKQIIEAEEKINYSLQKAEFKTFSAIFNNIFNVALGAGYEFCSVIEKNDVVGLNWYNIANSYQLENPDIDMFFPLIRNTTNGVFSHLMNEAPWAEGMAEEAGKIDLNLLTRFNCILPLGGIFKVKSLQEYSEEKDGKFFPFKESVKLSHYYEFFMRMIYNDLKGMSVPRIGYELKESTATSFDENSCKIPKNLTAISVEKGGFVPVEAQFWMDLAKKEYFFDEDRRKSYEPQPINNG